MTVDRLPPHVAASLIHRIATNGPKEGEEESMSSETITFNRTEFYTFVAAQGLEGFASNLPDEIEDPRLALAKVALQDMCDCAVAFQGRETIPASEFLEKAGPVVANAASVLGQISE